MEKKNNKNDFNIITLWKMFRSESGKRYTFIIFYFFFFIFLFIFIGNNRDVATNMNSTDEFSLPIKTMVLENKPYKFSYTIETNLGNSEYLGEKNNNLITLKDDKGIYNYQYKNGNLVKISNIENDIPYDKLLDIYEIKRIIKNSKLISETKLNITDEYIYNYTITSEILSELLEINNKPNIEIEISIKTNKDKEIHEFTLDLFNMIEEQKGLSKYIVKIKYGDINE